MGENPISKVYLLDVPLENDYKNTLYFTNKSEQQNYFHSRKVKEYTNFTYQRKDNVIYVPTHYDDIYNCNYVMYQNTKYNNKWFYAFIKDMKYETDNCTIIEIETDVMQTWMFDYEIKPSFVEREHVSDDAIGLHTQPEGLETGEFVVNAHTKDDHLDDYVFVAGYTDKLTFEGEEVKSKTYNGKLHGGIFSGLNYHAYRPDYLTNLNNMLKRYDEAGKKDSIVTLFVAPVVLTGMNETNYDLEIPSSKEASVYYLNQNKNYAMNGYTPKNKKLYTYPFNYLLVSNNAGGNAVYKYEHFKDNVEFRVDGVVCPGCSIRLRPMKYKGAELNDEEGLNLGKYPICSWSSDTYTNWLTQNSVNIVNSYISSGLQIAAGVGMMFTGAGALAGAGAVANGLLGISNTMGQKYEMEVAPNQAKGNTNCGDVVASTKTNTFHFYNMSIKKEYAERIDKYFDVYGYQVNMVKVPNKAHRSRWWFTKTISINIDGSIPGNDMQKIKDCYNNGITFWRNASEINNYNLSNNIV